MLCETPDYGAFIHHGGRNDKARGLQQQLGDTWYLFGLASGGGRWNGRTIPAPAVLLLPPRSGRLEAPAAARWELLAFDLVRVPLRHLDTSPEGVARTHVHPVPQPDGVALWGTAPPVEVPEEERDRAMNCLRYCGRWWWRGPLDRARVNAALLHWVTDYATRGREGDRGRQLPDWLQPVLAAMEGGLAGGVTVAECARIAGISRQAFHRRFTAAMLETPRDHLLRLRMERAAELLRQAATVDGTSRLVGYRSPSTFSKQFLAWHGRRPGAFRRSG